MVLRGLPVKIRISRADEITCLKAAIQFVENGDETLDTDRRYNTGITFYERIAELAETIASEWVVARHLGFAYDPFEPKMKKKADVGDKFEVKWTKYAVGQLIVHEYDRTSDIAILVTGQTPHYYIAGWIPVSIAQKPRFRHSHQPNWWVSQINLQPIDNLRKSIHGNNPV
jgi:hypothetical protein